jgi:hypothetical protein
MYQLRVSTAARAQILRFAQDDTLTVSEFSR